MCTVKARHKDNYVKCRLFVVQVNGPALLQMPEIELLSILRIVCDIIGCPLTEGSSTHKQRHLVDQTAEQTKPHG